MDTTVQRMKLMLEFEYDAEVFENDPDDAFELAELEQEYLFPAIKDVMNAVHNPHSIGFSVKPVI